MIAALSPKPEYPIPGERVVISFTGLNSSTNFVRVFAATAPPKSDLYSRIQKATKERVIVHAGDTSQIWATTPDVGGVYTFTLEEYSITSPALAAFQDDTGGAPSPTALAQTTVTLYVGQKLTHKLGTVQDSADLEVFVWNDTIRATSLEVHGIVTPAVRNGSSKAAEAASEASSVTTAATNLAGSTASTVVGNVATIYADLRDKYQAHAANGTAHDAADAANTISDGYTAASPKAAEESINTLLRVFLAHIRNEGVASGGTDPHPEKDGTNVPVLTGASADPASQIAMLTSFWMSYSDHLADTTVHASADATNTPGALSPLMTVHRRFFEALADQSPTPPAGTHAAVTTLGQLAGFKEAQ